MHLEKPEWIKVKIQGGNVSGKVNSLISELSLNTVCNEANCPNRMECYERGTATFMILGRNCTRNCTFCNVTKKKPEKINPMEPENVAKAVAKLGLKHAVITSVTRDDLEDQGANQFARVVEKIRNTTPEVTIELLIPDMQGNKELVDIIINSEPNILNHNVETVPELYYKIRPMAVFDRSIELLGYVKKTKPAAAGCAVDITTGGTGASLAAVTVNTSVPALCVCAGKGAVVACAAGEMVGGSKAGMAVETGAAVGTGVGAAAIKRTVLSLSYQVLPRSRLPRNRPSMGLSKMAVSVHTVRSGSTLAGWPVISTPCSSVMRTPSMGPSAVKVNTVLTPSWPTSTGASNLISCGGLVSRRPTRPSAPSTTLATPPRMVPRMPWLSLGTSIYSAPPISITITSTKASRRGHRRGASSYSSSYS
mgnify:CR=1 FL=1